MARITRVRFDPERQRAGKKRVKRPYRGGHQMQARREFARTVGRYDQRIESQINGGKNSYEIDDAAPPNLVPDKLLALATFGYRRRLLVVRLRTDSSIAHRLI